MSKHESPETKKAKAELKSKNKGNNMKKVIIITVVSTLAVVAAFATTFYLGTQFQENQHKAVARQVETLAAQLKTNE